MQKNHEIKERKDLLSFKKALFLLKANDPDEAKKLLENLIRSDSVIKSLLKKF